MIMIKYDVFGKPIAVEPMSCSLVFPKSIVEPDQSLSIREIYHRWTKGKSTSIHPFSVEFDDDADTIDYEDSENPIDRVQVENDVINARDSLEYEKQSARLKKKEKQSHLDELRTVIREATKEEVKQ